MKIGIVGDIHYGPDAEARLGRYAPEQLRTVRDAMRAFGPACVVDVGDRINDIAAQADRERTAWVRGALAEAGVPVYHLLGNHDIVNLSKEDLCALLGKRAPYEYVDLVGVRLVLLDSQDPAVEQIGGTVGPEQLAWLALTIRESWQPCLVFCHHPLDEQPLAGGYFEAHPGHAHARNRAQARRILEEAGRVLAVVSGHMHWTRATVINGIPYVTVGSLVDGGFTGGRPCGTFSEVTIDASGIDVRVAGLLPVRFHFDHTP